jgi:plasmid stabilization system protein ParE
VAAVDWAVDARADLQLIREFIARHSPANARRFADRLVAATKRLERHPNLGRVVPELDDDRTRELIVGNYRVVYRVFPERVSIVALVHARRDMLGLAGDREWIERNE